MKRKHRDSFGFGLTINNQQSTKKAIDHVMIAISRDVNGFCDKKEESESKQSTKRKKKKHKA